MDADGFLQKLVAEHEAGESLVHVQRLPARPPSPQPFPDDVPELLADRLRLLGIDGLYLHQLRALQALSGGGDVVVATGTASGKTLVYNMAFAAEVLNDRDRLVDALLEPRQDFLFRSGEDHLLFQRFLFHEVTSLTGNAAVSRDARFCCSAETSS